VGAAQLARTQGSLGPRAEAGTPLLPLLDPFPMPLWVVSVYMCVYVCVCAFVCVHVCRRSNKRKAETKLDPLFPQLEKSSSSHL